MSESNPVLIQVRSKLQESGIKLWLEPYYNKNSNSGTEGAVDSELMRLAKDLSQELNINENTCLEAIKELQNTAITKLQAREEFQKTGIATLKVKVVRANQPPCKELIKCSLSDTGEEFQQKLAGKIQEDFNKLKIIASGKVLQSELPLNLQNISNNQQLMALVETEKNSNGNLSIYDRVRKVKEDAELILNSESQSFFNMEDQDGNAVYLPPGEKKAITLALALYEKGRSVMKQEQYAEALILFLEADDQFSSCNSVFLNSVDNYALLNLDIVWCYLCLKSFDQLTDAERRLKICEKNFKKSYGNNMDRVVALKGNSQNERALIMRLHLLQGILLFHQNKRNKSYEKLLLAENEIKLLKIDDTCLLQLLEMGYDATESRIALRSSNNNVEKAINFITDRRNKKKEARQRNREEEELLNFNFNDNKWINPRSLHTLIDMGYDKENAIVALKMSDNNIESAINLLLNNLQQIETESQKYKTVNNKLVEEVVRIGFDSEMAHIALEIVLNNADQAIELLRKLQSDGSYEYLLNALNVENSTTNLNEPGPSPECIAAQKKKKIREMIKEKIENEMSTLEAYKRFSEDMPTKDDEYLDLPLVQEEQILYEYKSLLEK